MQAQTLLLKSSCTNSKRRAPSKLSFVFQENTKPGFFLRAFSPQPSTRKKSIMSWLPGRWTR